MKKIDSIIRFIFMIVIFEFFLLQLLIRVRVVTLVNGYGIGTLHIYLYNLIAYVAFLFYNIVVLILHKLLKYKIFFDISKTIVIISLIFTTALILISLAVL